MLREEIKTRRFTVEEYHRMGEVGILGQDDRVELLGGELVEM
ncbi:MAG: Uma2 family endonuclease, partial [Actinomycetota bacterium]|nr:Uma2 family endonuclease [Actinomycetota bacterium]